MDLNGTGEVRNSVGQVAMVYGVGFAMGSLTRIRARDRSGRSGIKIGSHEELTEIRRVAEYGEQSADIGVREENVVAFPEETFQNMDTLCTNFLCHGGSSPFNS